MTRPPNLALLRQMREERGLTQKQLAEDAGLHPMFISKVERGVIKDIGLGTLIKIADVLNMTPAACVALLCGGPAIVWLPVDGGFRKK